MMRPKFEKSEDGVSITIEDEWLGKRTFELTRYNLVNDQLNLLTHFRDTIRKLTGQEPKPLLLSDIDGYEAIIAHNACDDYFEYKTHEERIRPSVYAKYRGWI